jgi:hypothetical protein
MEKTRLYIAITLILTVSPVLVIYYLLRARLVRLWSTLLLNELKRDVERRATYDHLLAKRPMWNQIQPLRKGQFDLNDLG